MAKDRAPREAPTKIQIAKETAAISEAYAQAAEADARAEAAKTSAATSKARRKLTWLYLIGSVVGVVIGLPTVTSLCKLVIAAIRQ